MTTTPPRTASNILELILNNTEDEQLPFKVSIGPGPAVYPTLLHVHPDCTMACPCVMETCDCEDDVSVGGAVGLAFFGLGLGIFLGIILALIIILVLRFCYRRRSTVLSTVKYEKHQDD